MIGPSDMTPENRLLTETDGPAVEVHKRDGAGRLLLTCEHASNRLPAALGNLGLDDEALQSHIAWDPGARAVALRLSEAFDAPLVMPCFSRLAYDCNRPPSRADAIAVQSEGRRVPGNMDLSHDVRAVRARALHDPFHDAVEAAIAERQGAGRPPVLLTLHSFTPVFLGQTRDVELGLLHDDDARLADACLTATEALGQGPRTARNQPYGPTDGVTYTLRKHALPHGLLNLMLEIRNDLIADDRGQEAMADWLRALLTRALADLDHTASIGGTP